MEEIKVGEYVRTKKGSIGKFKFYGIDDVDNKIVYFKNHNGTNCVDENRVTKHSQNIIDLIEVGDYVNGHLVVELSENVYGQRVMITEVDGKNGAIRHHYLERGIKSIVTKEQFEIVKYEV